MKPAINNVYKVGKSFQKKFEMHVHFYALFKSHATFKIWDRFKNLSILCLNFDGILILGFQIDFYFLNLFRLHSTLLHFRIPGFNPMEPSVKSIV